MKSSNSIDGLQFRSQVLHAGSARTRTVVLDEELSFWGGYDPNSGRIIDQHHPQAGVCVAGLALVLPASRGSAGTPAGVAESLRVGRGPAAIIVHAADVNIAIGAAVAARLYKLNMPVVALARDDYAMLQDDQHIDIRDDGLVTISDHAGDPQQIG